MPAARRPEDTKAPAAKKAAAPKGPKLNPNTEVAAEVIIPGNHTYIVVPADVEGVYDIWKWPEGVATVTDPNLFQVKDRVSLARALELLAGYVAADTKGAAKPGPAKSIAAKKAAPKAAASNKRDEDAPYGRFPDGTPKQKPGRKPKPVEPEPVAKRAPAKKAVAAKKAPAKAAAPAAKATKATKAAKAPQKAVAATKASGRPSARARA